MSASAHPLGIAQLETVYDTLAEAIDAAGSDQAELFLTKLCLLLANEIGDDARFDELVQTALRDLKASDISTKKLP